MQSIAPLSAQNGVTMRQVISPKVDVVKNISDFMHAKATSGSLFCSSVASLAGYSGQANYAAANSTLDAFAINHQATGCPTFSIQWGAWSSVGEVHKPFVLCLNKNK